MEQPSEATTPNAVPSEAPTPYAVPSEAPKPNTAPSQAPTPYAAPNIQAPYSTPVSVVGPQFCAPYPVDLAIVRKVLTLNEGNFTVTDINDNVMFKVKAKVFTLHDKRVLLDGAGNPVVTLTKKIMSMHDRWHVFRGESTDTKDLVFTVKRSSIIQLKTNLEVFLANNTKEEVCDFTVKGSWLERSCIIYAGDSFTIVAQMHKKHSVQSVLLGKDKFMVTVYPNIDHAFIVALIVILDGINENDGDDI